MSLKVKRNYFFPVVLCTLALVTACEQQQQTVAVFDTPEAAIQALTELIDQNDKNSIEQVFGEGSADIFSSGDAEADREDYTRINEMIGEWVGFEDFDENTKIALLGDDAWSWPIPLVREGNGWRFDMVEGREELLNRRIGNNELWKPSVSTETNPATAIRRPTQRGSVVPKATTTACIGQRKAKWSRVPSASSWRGQKPGMTNPVRFMVIFTVSLPTAAQTRLAAKWTTLTIAAF